MKVIVIVIIWAILLVCIVIGVSIWIIVNLKKGQASDAERWRVRNTENYNKLRVTEAQLKQVENAYKELLEKNKSLTNLDRQIGERTIHYGWLKDETNRLEDRYKGLFSTNEALSAACDELRVQKEQLEQEKVNLGVSIDELDKKLEEGKKTHQQMVDVENGKDKDCRIKIDVPPRYQILYELILKLKTSYPEIAAELAAGIEWKRIWLPKLQDVVKLYDLSGACGIYKLTLKSDESKVYIGQAVDIKARWYQHAKKMIGAEVSGNEKLYEMVKSPEDVFWEVVERDVPQESLNEKEHYWIDFYKSNVVGMNIKA